MDCLVCRGACCEEVEVPLAPRLDPFVSEWLRARGILKGVPGYPTVRLDAKCPHLTPEGRCAVHCIAKPVLCASAKAGVPLVPGRGAPAPHPGGVPGHPWPARPRGPLVAWTPGQARALYERLRRRYFLDGQGLVAPLSKDLRWVWLPVGSSFRGAVHFDDDGHPHTLELNMGMLVWPTLLRTTLLHELTQMRLGPDKKCSSESSRVPAAWRLETARLANLGAPLV